MKQKTLSAGSLKVLSVLLSSAKEHHLHSLAASTHLSVMGISKIIKQLKERQLVTAVKVGKSHLIKINKSKENVLWFSLAEQYKFKEFMEKHHRLRGALAQLREKGIDLSLFSMIFGSYAAGEESTGSDLDIFIVTEHKKEVLQILKTISVILTIELSPIIVTPADFVLKARQHHRLYQEILQGKRIIISGEYDFWRLVLQERLM